MTTESEIFADIKISRTIEGKGRITAIRMMTTAIGIDSCAFVIVITALWASPQRARASVRPRTATCLPIDLQLTKPGYKARDCAVPPPRLHPVTFASTASTADYES